MRRLKKIDYKANFKLNYDPDDVNIRLQHFRISELLFMIENKLIRDDDFLLIDELELKMNTKSLRQISFFEEEEQIEVEGDDGLQRNTGLWNVIQKSQFIESLMIKLPIPLFYFDGSRKPWRIVDGLQRLHTIISFIKGEFKLVGLEYLSDECDKKAYKEIPGFLRKRILDAEIIAYVINPGTPSDVKYNIFKRINTGGLKLTGQEIRNAFFRGTPADFTKLLAEEDIFKKATNFKVRPRRMVDREYANRFIAFQVFDYKDYNGKMDVFLSEALMDLYGRDQNEFEEIRSNFLKSMNRAFDLFGGNAFYRPKIDGNWGRQPNKAIYDTLSWNLSELTERDFTKLLNKKEDLKKKYFHFMNNSTLMFNGIDNTTGSKTSVLNRFSQLENFLNNFI